MTQATIEKAIPRTGRSEDQGASSPHATLDKMTSGLRDYFAAHNFPGFSVAVGRRGSVFYAVARGWADPADQREMTPQTPMRLGSLSKVFTTAAILKLKQDNLIDLHDPLHKYFPHCERTNNQPEDPAALRITIKQLLNHTSGLPNDVDMLPYMALDNSLNFYLRPENLTYDAICRYVYGCKLLYAPGTNQTYSTIAYLILGRIIERVSGKPYFAYLHDAVLDPAGVGGITLGSSAPDGRSIGEAACFNIADLQKGKPEQEHTFRFGPSSYLECRDSAGGLVASSVALINAMMRFYEVNGAGVFTPASRENLLSYPDKRPDRDVETYVGLGWWVRRPVGHREERKHDPLFHTKLHHSGRTSGAVNFLFRGENGVWAAVQSNCGVSDGDWSELQKRIYDIVAWRIRSLD